MTWPLTDAGKARLAATEAQLAALPAPDPAPAWNQTRAVLAGHAENYDLQHHGCSCGAFGPDDAADGHQWWLDHAANQLTQPFTNGGNDDR